MTEPTPASPPSADPARATRLPRHASLSFVEKLRHGEFLLLTSREQMRLCLLILAVLAVLLWIVFGFIEPPPPRHIRISTGAPTGAYTRYAQQYAAGFARQGITLEIVTSAGSVENLTRLDDPAQKIDLAFVQGGVGSADEHPQVVGLANIAYEPIWFFYDKKVFAGGPPPTTLRDLAGHSLAIDAEGSGVRVAAMKLLAMNKMDAAGEKWVPLGGMAAIDALLAGTLDAAIVVSAVDSPVVEKALSHDLGLMSLAQADAYVRLLPWLAKVDLPRGVADVAHDIPHQDVVLVAATANLVARANLHRAIMFLALEIASNVHRKASAVNAQNTFLSDRHLDYPESDESQRFFRSGRPFLQEYLPFWLANLVERLIAVLVPLLAIGLPLMRLVPAILNWRVLSRLTQLYEEVLAVEERPHDTQAQRAASLGRLAEIDHLLPRLNLGAAHHVKVYNLKSHIDLVRARLSAA